MKIGNVILKEDGSVRAAMCLVSPDEAEKLLELNTHNRPPSEGVSKKLADEMIRGEWLPTCQGIGFDTNRVMLDGQHRLYAIILSGIPCWMLVVTGLPSGSQVKIDRNRYIRTLFHAWVLAGYCNNTRQDKKMIEVAVHFARKNSPAKMCGDAAVKEYFDLYREQLNAIMKVPGTKYLSPVGVRAAAVLAHEIYGDKAVDFYTQLQRGIGYQSKTDPIYRLRNLLEAGRLKNACGGGGYQESCFQKTCYAFNAWIRGDKISSVLNADNIVKPEK